MSNHPIQVTTFDLERLRNLIETYRSSGKVKKEPLDELEKELDRAVVVDPSEISGEVVTMNSTICMEDMHTGDQRTISLVFPSDADLDRGKISILAPVGMALLGYRKDATIEWKVPSGIRKFKITRIVYQPEAAGRFDI